MIRRGRAVGHIAKKRRLEDRSRWAGTDQEAPRAVNAPLITCSISLMSDDSSEVSAHEQLP